MNRERKVDVSKIKDIDEMSKNISNKVSKITEEAVIKVNAILKIYGMKAEMQIAINQIKE